MTDAPDEADPWRPSPVAEAMGRFLDTVEEDYVRTVETGEVPPLPPDRHIIAAQALWGLIEGRPPPGTVVHVIGDHQGFIDAVLATAALAVSGPALLAGPNESGVLYRVLSQMAAVPVDRLVSRLLLEDDWPRISTAARDLRSRPLLLSETPFLSEICRMMPDVSGPIFIMRGQRLGRVPAVLHQLAATSKRHECAVVIGSDARAIDVANAFFPNVITVWAMKDPKGVTGRLSVYANYLTWTESSLVELSLDPETGAISRAASAI